MAKNGKVKHKQFIKAGYSFLPQGLSSIIKMIGFLLIRCYQVSVKPFLPMSCRFYPSCSEYAIGCLDQHGVVRGGFFIMARLARCHPWHAGGEDPVPEKRSLSVCPITDVMQEGKCSS